MNTKKYHIVGIVPASIGRIVERGKIDNSNTQSHSIVWLGTGDFCLSHFLFFHVYMSVVRKDLDFPQTVLLSVDGTICVW
jgi:hypothetical protein